MKYIELTRGYKAMVDDEDYERLSHYHWSALVQKKAHSIRVYAVRNHTQYKVSRMHRFILGATPEYQVDHIDGNGLNNQKNNLRLCTNQQNQFNCGSKNNKTGFKGVSYMPYVRGKKHYYARIMKNGKYISCGYHHTILEAAKAYDKKARELFGEFARTNFN